MSGDPQRDLAWRYGLSPSALNRHYHHLNRRLVKSKQAQTLVSAEAHLVELAHLKEEILAMAREAKNSGRQTLALQAFREAVHVLTAISKLRDAREDAPTPDVLMSQEWRQLRKAIMRALEPHPDIRLAVSEALKGPEGW
jgi:DNA-binding transcriptional MocR family regulator